MPPSPHPSDAELVARAANDLIELSRSRGWGILMLRLRGESQEAADALVDVDPNDTVTIQRLQDNVKRCRWFEATLESMLSECVAHEEVLAAQEEIEDGEPQPQQEEEEQ